MLCFLSRNRILERCSFFQSLHMPRPKPRDRPLVLILSISSSLSTDMQILFDVTHFLRHRYSNSVRRSTTGLHFLRRIVSLNNDSRGAGFWQRATAKRHKLTFFSENIACFWNCLCFRPGNWRILSRRTTAPIQLCIIFSYLGFNSL